MKCVIERNGRRSVKTIPDLFIRGIPSDQFRGTSVIRDCHFESDDVEHLCIDLDDARAVDILRNYITLSDVQLGAGTANCLVARNCFLTGGNSANAGDVFVHTQSTANAVASAGAEANVYLHDTVTFKGARSYP